MAAPDHEEWIAAALSEVRVLEKNETWVEVPLSDAETKILPGTWVFRRKRTPDGIVKKHKGQYCCRGDLEEGVFDTTAYVVFWSTVRLFLVLSLTWGWSTCSIDFASTFVQAKLEKPVWIHPPRGFHSTLPGKTCLRLLKSLYGLRVAPRQSRVATLGEGPSRIGIRIQCHCLFIKPGMMLVTYVNDCGVSARDPANIDRLIADLTQKGFALTRERSFSEFLGIKIAPMGDGTGVHLTQKGLISKIINVTGMQGCNPNHVPATQFALGSNPDGDPMHEIWSYSSVIGMMLYLR